MTPTEAARLLELPVEATAEQIELRFLELRRKLEDRIAKAPTPGLQAKYRESLAELTSAYEALALAADSSALPVLKKQGTGSTEPAVGGPAAPRAAAPATPSLPVASAATKPKGGGKEFLLVAGIAVVVLGVGGWWVMKTKAENEEKARLAVEAKVRAEDEAAAKKKAEDEEKSRLEQIRVQLRTVIAEAKIAWEIAERTERDADRRLSELRAELRSLRDPQPDLAARLNRRIDSAQRYSNWLRDFMLNHPLKVARAKLEELVQAGAVKDAESDGAEVRQLTQALRADLAAHPNGEGSLEVKSNLPTLRWTLRNLVDGELRRGEGTGRIGGLLFERYELTLQNPPFRDERRTLQLLPGQPAIAEADYDFDRIRINNVTPDTRLFVAGLSGLQPWHPLPDGTYPIGQKLEINYWFAAHRSGHLTTGGNMTEGETKEVTLHWVPLQQREVFGAALAGLKDAQRLLPIARAESLPRLLQASDRSGLLTAAERTELIHEVLAELDFARLPETTPNPDEARFRLLRARLPLLVELQWCDPILAELAYGRMVRDLAQLSEARRLQVILANFFLPGIPSAMQDYVAAIRPLLTRHRTDVPATTLLMVAADIHGFLHLTDSAEAARWQEEFLAQRDPATRTSDLRSFEQARHRSLAQREHAPLIRALVMRNHAEFNRLAEPGLSEPTTGYSGWLLARLLDHGFERQAADLAASINGAWTNTFVNHARRTGRFEPLEDYLARERLDSNFNRVRAAELFALTGNRTKARLWLEKTDPVLDQELRLQVLAHLGDADGVRALFAELDKQGISFRDQTDRDNRLPQLLLCARAINDPERERRLLELAGVREPRIRADLLLAFGDRPGALDELFRSGYGVPGFVRSSVYQNVHLRPGLRDELPYFPDSSWEFELQVSTLLRLNGDLGPSAIRLVAPLAQTTKVAVKKSALFYFPTSQVNAGVKTGQARLLVNVDAAGKPTGSTTLSATHPDFAAELYKSVAQWEFYPALTKGRPVASTYEITRDFRLRE